MSPKDFAARFHLRKAEGPDGCCSGRCCVYARMRNKTGLDAGGDYVSWVCDNPFAREPGLCGDGTADASAWMPYTGSGERRKMRAGASNVAVSYLAGADTICDLFAPLGNAAPTSARPNADA